MPKNMTATLDRAMRLIRDNAATVSAHRPPEGGSAPRCPIRPASWLGWA